MLLKNHEERREIVVRDAKMMLLNIIEQTTKTTKANWQNGTKKSIKDSLNRFVNLVRDNKIVGWLEELDEFGCIQDFCNGKHDLDIKSLKDCLDAIRNSLFH